MVARSAPSWLVIATCALLVGTASLLCLSAVSIAADGAFYLLRLIQTGEPVGPDFRYIGGALRQAPALVGTHLGVTNTSLLAILLSLGVLLLPALLWCVALVVTRRSFHVFAAVAMTAGLCAGTTWFFSMGENLLAVPLSVLVAALLWLPRPWAAWHAVLGGVAAAVLGGTYESALVTGSILAVWATLRAVRGRRRSVTGIPERWGVVAVGVASAASALAALVAVGAGRQQGQNQTHVQSLVYHVVSLEPWQLYVALAALWAIVASLTPEIPDRVRPVLLVIGAAGAAITIVDLVPTTTLSFTARGGALVVGLALQLYLFWDWNRHSSGSRAPISTSTESRSRLGVVFLAIPALFVAGMLVADLRGLRDWNAGFDAFQAEVDRTSGLRSVDVLPPDRRQLVWNWTATSLSLIVRSSPNAGVLIDANPTFVPFPPESTADQLAPEYTWRR